MDKEIVYYIITGIQTLLILGVFLYQRSIISSMKEYVEMLRVDKLKEIMSLYESALDAKKSSYEMEYESKIQSLTKTQEKLEKGHEGWEEMRKLYKDTMDELVEKNVELLSLAHLVIYELGGKMTEEARDKFLNENFEKTKEDIKKYRADFLAKKT